MLETEDIKAEDVSILAWILKSQLKNEKGEPIEFHDRLYLLDILTDWNPRIVIKKASQVGGSLIFNLKALFAVMKLRLNVIYTFPTDSDTREFVSSKTNKILIQNPQVFAGLPTDNIERKEINGRFLFFKGTESKTAAIMTTADVLVHDEASRSDQPTLQLMRSRTKASKFGWRWIFSNPTTDKDAVDEEWLISDQKEWSITCTGCDEEQVLRWPESIDLERKVYQCQVCKKELTREERRVGTWVAQNPGSTVSGYHMTHLMVLDIPAEQIITDSQGDQEYFHNFVLGEPYNPGDISISRGFIMDNWTPRDLVGKGYYLGVDVGNVKHYVLGSEQGIIKVGTFTDWKDLDELMLMYKPMLCIDALPEDDMARYYVKHYPGAHMSFFKENMDNPQTIVWWGEKDKAGIVYSNRNRILDQLIDEILNARILFGIQQNKILKTYIDHWLTLRRIKVTNAKGIEHYEWVSSEAKSGKGQDHYVFATLYYWLARLSGGAGTFLAEPGAVQHHFIRDNVVTGPEEYAEIIANNSSAGMV